MAESQGTPVRERVRKPSVESIKRASVGSKRSSASLSESSNTSDHKGELSESYIQSKFNRKGSTHYRNAGWKSPQNVLERKDSASSVKSNVSNKEVVSKATSQCQASPAQRSSVEQQTYVYQKFVEISEILKNCGIAEDILQMMQS